VENRGKLQKSGSEKKGPQEKTLKEKPISFSLSLLEKVFL